MNRWYSIAMAALSVGWLFAGCTTTHEDASQGQTHWLAQCEDDADCGGELSCECGVCAAPCDARGECAVEGRDTQCYSGVALPVTLICEGMHERDLCLQTCEDGSCPSGQRCVDEACVVEPAGGSSGSGGESGEGGGGGASGTIGGAGAGGAAGTSVTDGGAPDGAVLEPRDFELGIANVSELSIVLYSGSCSSDWAYTLSVGGEPLNVDQGCECENADPEGGCPTPPPSCPQPMFHEVRPGDEYVFRTWDLSAWNSEPYRCGERVRVPDDTEIELKVCWLDREPEDPLAPLDSRTCQRRTFVSGPDSGYSIPVPIEPLEHLDD